MVCELCAREYVTFRRMNRVLRTVNSALRRRIERHKEQADQIFLTLCATDRPAEIALGELWGSGLLDCGPQDYDAIVKQSIRALTLAKGLIQPQEPNL